MTPHMHAAVIKALADGKTLQFNYINSGWEDNHEVYFTAEASYYRIKPETLSYRVGLFKSPGRIQRSSYYVSNITKEDQEKTAEDSPNFIRWLTDWTEVELP